MFYRRQIGYGRAAATQFSRCQHVPAKSMLFIAPYRPRVLVICTDMQLARCFSTRIHFPRNCGKVEKEEEIREYSFSFTPTEMYRYSYISAVFKFDTIIFVFPLTLSLQFFTANLKFDSVKCFEADVEGKVIIREEVGWKRRKL